jgi:hypothetical protein
MLRSAMSKWTAVSAFRWWYNGVKVGQRGVHGRVMRSCGRYSEPLTENATSAPPYCPATTRMFAAYAAPSEVAPPARFHLVALCVEIAC